VLEDFVSISLLWSKIWDCNPFFSFCFCCLLNCLCVATLYLGCRCWWY